MRSCHIVVALQQLYLYFHTGMKVPCCNTQCSVSSVCNCDGSLNQGIHIKLHFYICIPYLEATLADTKQKERDFQILDFIEIHQYDGGCNTYKIHGLEQVLYSSSTCVKNFSSALQQGSDQVCSKISFSFF
jgi:hypothetical protein